MKTATDKTYNVSEKITLLLAAQKRKTITLRYAVKDRVWISELKCPATITAIYISDIGTQYQCRWFDNREPKTAYFFENEVEDIPATEQPGFSQIAARLRNNR